MPPSPSSGGSANHGGASAAPAIVVDDVTFAWPDATVALDHLSCTFPTGPVGANGTGQSMLLRLVAGEPSPDSGSIRTTGRGVHLRQHLGAAAPDTGDSVADLLGLTRVRAALRRIEAGVARPGRLRPGRRRLGRRGPCLGALSRLGLDGDAGLLERPASTLSGGQAMQVALAGLQLAEVDITLLDEPTNNLDARARHRVHEPVATWPGVLVVVSHDRDLLDRVDAVVDLDATRFHGSMQAFGGTFSQYRAWRAQQQEAAQRDLREADAELARARSAARVEQERSTAA